MSRRGFTLVELLVVAGIFAMLFGMVLNGARPNPSRQTKQTAQSIASVLLSTQSKALGNPMGAGIVLDPADMFTFLTGTAVTRVSAADNLPWITGGGPLVPDGTRATIAFRPNNAALEDCRHGYKIQFIESSPAVQPASVWFDFNAGPVLPPDYSSITGTVGFRAAAGQTLSNTIWPTAASGDTEARIARYPGKAESLYDLPKGVAIDLRYSGIGDDPAAMWGGLAGKGAIALTFDSIGSVDMLMQQVLDAADDRGMGREPVHPVSPVYLLVATQADIIANASLSTADSMWVTVHPQTGRVSVAANVAQSATNATALRNARANARAQAMIGK